MKNFKNILIALAIAAIAGSYSSANALWEDLVKIKSEGRSVSKIEMVSIVNKAISEFMQSKENILSLQGPNPRFLAQIPYGKMTEQEKQFLYQTIMSNSSFSIALQQILRQFKTNPVPYTLSLKNKIYGKEVAQPNEVKLWENLQLIKEQGQTISKKDAMSSINDAIVKFEQSGQELFSAQTVNPQFFINIPREIMSSEEKTMLLNEIVNNSLFKQKYDNFFQKNNYGDATKLHFDIMLRMNSLIELGTLDQYEKDVNAIRKDKQ